MAFSVSNNLNVGGIGAPMDISSMTGELQELATELNTDLATVQSAAQATSQEISPLVQQAQADGVLDENERDQIQSQMAEAMQRNLEALGEEISPEEMHDILNFCTDCIDMWAQQAAEQAGFNLGGAAPGLPTGAPEDVTAAPVPTVGNMAGMAM